VFTNMAIYNPTLPVEVLGHAHEPDEVLRDGRGAQSVRNPVALADRSPIRRPRTASSATSPARCSSSTGSRRRRRSAPTTRAPSARPTSRAAARSAPSSTAWRVRPSVAAEPQLPAARHGTPKLGDSRSSRSSAATSTAASRTTASKRSCRAS
jgi:hypothetical protein